MSDVDLEAVRKQAKRVLQVYEAKIRWTNDSLGTSLIEDVSNNAIQLADEVELGNSAILKQIEVNTRLREALESCEANDMTPHYEYGDPNRNGKPPGVGKRWNTPREIARAALADEQGEKDD